MLRLFRNIRQTLLNEGETAKYFKYALGEIVLIVAGILIALQIQTWNEGRIQNNEDKNLTGMLRSELVEFQDYNREMLQSLTTQTELIRALLDSTEKEQIETLIEEAKEETIVQLFTLHGALVTVTEFYDPGTNIYDSIVNNGSISIISDRKLVNLLGYVYVQRRAILDGLHVREASNVENLHTYLSTQYPDETLRLFKPHTPEESDEINAAFWNAFQTDGTAIGLLTHRAGLINSRRLVLQGIINDTDEYLNSIGAEPSN